MAGLSDIEWTDATWNPVTGCTILSPGCTNCYAMRMAARLQAMDHPAYEGVTRKSGKRQVWTGRVHENEKALEAPLGWKRPKRIFVNSMSDLFQEGVSREYVARVWDVMARASWHEYQILTKRPDRMLSLTTSGALSNLPNVWLGTSVESAKYTDRITLLRKVPAAVRFISFEPLIGAVGQVDLDGIDWAIVGGESGPGSRPMDVRWIDDIKSSCDSHGTAFFFKQWGGTNKKATGREYQGRTWDDYPESRAT
jgi:protein gp37